MTFFHIMQKKQAKELGFKMYFDGHSCSHGFYWQRFTRNGECACESHRKAQYESKKKKAKERYNSDPIYREQKLAKNRKPLSLNPLNKNSVDSKSKAYRSAKSSTNRVKMKAPECMPEIFTELDEFTLQQCFDLKELRESATNIDWSVDHMIPIKSKQSGLHKWDNFQVIPFYLNLYKSNKLVLTKPFEWINYA